MTAVCSVLYVVCRLVSHVRCLFSLRTGLSRGFQFLYPVCLLRMFVVMLPSAVSTGFLLRPTSHWSDVVCRSRPYWSINRGTLITLIILIILKLMITLITLVRNIIVFHHQRSLWLVVISPQRRHRWHAVLRASAWSLRAALSS
jgi:hypothetical protein